jgi:hypothetical protein
MHRSQLLRDIDPAAMSGLEIGALDKPAVRRTDGKVRYVDYADTATVKAKPYDDSIDVEAIVDVDIVWAERPLAEAVGEPVDYIVASHVIEHVPDLIGWLADLSAALKPGGILSLALPDKRFTFDLQRPDSTLGEVVEAYLLGARRPSIRQVVDNCFSAVVVRPQDAWAQDLSGADLPRLGGDIALALAWDQAKDLVREPRYIDSHCWVFTPQSFLTLLDTLAQLKLLPLSLRSFSPTRPGDMEFFAQFTPCDPGAVEAIRASIAPHRTPEPSHAEQRLAAVERSHSWRVTAPLRAVMRRLTAR